MDWHLIEEPLHGGVQKLVRDLNRVYGSEDALWEADSEPAGFEWIDVDNAAENIVAFIRRSPAGRDIICVANFSAVRKNGYRLGLPLEGDYESLINTDIKQYGGGDDVIGDLQSEPVASHGRQHSALIDLPPLTTMWLCMRSSRR